MPAVARKNFRVTKPKTQYPHLPNARLTTRERGNDFQGWAISRNGCSRVVDGETLAGCGVIARSPHGRIDVMFGFVVTPEAHLTFSGARTDSNNTQQHVPELTPTTPNKNSQMTPMIEALSFLGPFGPVARDMDSRIFYDSKHAVVVCLGMIPHTCSPCVCVSAVDVVRPTQVTANHALVHGHIGDC